MDSDNPPDDGGGAEKSCKRTADGEGGTNPNDDTSTNGAGKDTAKNMDRPPGAKRKRERSSDNNGNNSSKHSKLDESATVDDLSAMDASTYLTWVRQQADCLPNVFVATADEYGQATSLSNSKEAKITTSAQQVEQEEEPIHGSMATLQVLLSKRMDILPPPSARHLPTNHNSWVATTISNFSKLRSYLEQESASKKMHDRKIAVPRMKDRSAWHLFCLGRDEAYGNVGGYYEDDDEFEEVQEEENANNAADENENGGGHEKKTSPADNETTKPSSSSATQSSYDPSNVPPNGYPLSTSLLLQFDQVLTRRLFHHHVHYLCEYKLPLTPNRSKWIYALLARMEKPWHREECCAVRSVLRECCARRYELFLPPASPISASASGGKTDDKPHPAANEVESEAWEQLAHLNTLIAITGIYYEQGAIAGGDGIDTLFSVQKES